MSDRTGRTAAARVRGSRAEIDAVKKTAQRAGLQLAREQDDSVSHVAQALAQISENEGIGQLDGRLTFAERQLERLSGRREESDRLIDSELSVMRTRLEETLTAFAAATQEHKEIMAASERRLMALASEAERHTRAMLEGIRLELSEKVDDATRSVGHLEARLRGEKKAFDEETAQRAADLAESIAAGREMLEERVVSAVADLDARLDAAVERLDAAQPIDRELLLGEVEGRMYEWLADPLEQVERLHAELEAAHAAAHAEVVEVRGELLDAVHGSEEKALGAAVHLESIILQVRRRLVGDEAEWSAVVGEAGEAMAGLRSRVEDLLSRVCGIEARDAAERGSSGALLESIEKRLDGHEEWSLAAINEVSAQGLRINAFEAQMAGLAELRMLSEEQAGVIEYLQGRLHGIEQHPVPEASTPAEPSGTEEPSAEETWVPEDLTIAPDSVEVIGAESAPAFVEDRLDVLAEGQAALARRLDEIEDRLSTPLTTPKRSRWA